MLTWYCRSIELWPAAEERLAFPQVLIASPGSKDLLLERCRLAAPLWSANIPTECGIEKKPGFMDQIKRADKEGIPIVVVMGEEELQKVRPKFCGSVHAQEVFMRALHPH